MRVRGEKVELVEETVPLRGRELLVLRPRDSDQLIDEEAFEREEFLPYWAELWPSGVALARALDGRSLGGRRVVELGCGLAVPSIAAALAGASTVATDWSEDALRFAAENAARNGARIETALVRWEEPDALVARGPFDLVLASDVLYERRNAELLLPLLPRLGGEVLLADPGRPSLTRFLDAAEAGWEVVRRVDDLLPNGAIVSLRRRARGGRARPGLPAKRPQMRPQ